MRYFIFFLILFVTNFSYAAEVCIKPNLCYNAPVMKTPEELKKGLMFVRKMPKNDGMLFDFQGYSNIAMWMKNTYIPLDMLFMDCALKISDIFENAKPLSLDIIKPKGEVCYVLEINAGEVKAHDIQIGSVVEIKQ